MNRMRAISIVVTITSSLCCASCSRMKEIYQQGVAQLRKPGEERVASPEMTRKHYCCPPFEKNALFVEETEALPETAFPGEEINHRIKYAFCPRVPSGVMRARMVRKVVFEGHQVFKDVDTYTFSPGTWTVDAFIRIPRSARTGWYAVQLEINCPDKTIKRRSTFFVRRSASR